MHQKKYFVLKNFWVYIVSLILIFPFALQAQEKRERIPRAKAQREGLEIKTDSVAEFVNDTVFDSANDTHIVIPDSVKEVSEIPVSILPTWKPDPNKSVWLATLFPGAGQIYNRKYWKLPIFYGGFVACTYALTWNNRMYKDYSQAYIDIMDSDPRTNSFVDFLPPNYDVSNPSVINQLKGTFKNKKDYYRKYRDLSIFAFVGVYILSIIDAYVDAELSSFDISEDLSMGISPTIINDSKSRSNAYGLQYRLTF